MNDGYRIKEQELWIPGPLPGLNELLDARMRTGLTKNGKRWNAYSKLKKQWDQRVGMHARSQGFRPVRSAQFEYVVREPNRRRDPSNIVSGAVKLIEDGLQEAGLLEGDGWKNVLSYRSSWEISDEPGVLVRVIGMTKEGPRG